MSRKGVIYIMKCISLPGLIKIGKTETKQFESRMRGLEKDGYRHEMLQREYAIEVEDFDAKEKLLHRIYSTSQVGDSELFATDCKAAVELLKAFEGRQIYPIVEDKTKSRINNEKHVDTRILCHMGRRLQSWGDRIPQAKMEIRDGKFVVLTGSEICPVEKPGVSMVATTRRKNANIKNNILKSEEVFDSPSAAGVFVCNCADNGWTSWRLENGDCLQSIREELKR